MRVTLLLLTYNRLEYAKKTLKSSLDKIKYSGELAVHIADDGSPPGYVDELRRIAGGYKHIVSVGSTNADRGGYGRNYNLATQAIHASSAAVLCLEDDWELVSPLELDPLMEVFRATPNIGCIRLGYLGYTDKLIGHLERWNKQTFLVFDPASPEKHVFAGHPRLESVAWQRFVGPWPEGLNPGETELAVCSFARHGIAWPIDLSSSVGDIYHHIGTKQSY